MIKFLWLSFFIFSNCLADTPVLVSPDGQYLGKLTVNKFDPDSVNNKFGIYGSQFSPYSINNRFGEYGSIYSNKSWNNPYATQPPIIIYPGYDYKQ